MKLLREDMSLLSLLTDFLLVALLTKTLSFRQETGMKQHIAVNRIVFLFFLEIYDLLLILHSIKQSFIA